MILYHSLKTACLGKVWFSGYWPKCPQPIRLLDINFHFYLIISSLSSLLFLFLIRGSFNLLRLVNSNISLSILSSVYIHRTYVVSSLSETGGVYKQRGIKVYGTQWNVNNWIKFLRNIIQYLSILNPATRRLLFHLLLPEGRGRRNSFPWSIKTTYPSMLVLVYRPRKVERLSWP